MGDFECRNESCLSGLASKLLTVPEIKHLLLRRLGLQTSCLHDLQFVSYWKHAKAVKQEGCQSNRRRDGSGDGWSRLKRQEPRSRCTGQARRSQGRKGESRKADTTRAIYDCSRRGQCPLANSKAVAMAMSKSTYAKVLGEANQDPTIRRHLYPKIENQLGANKRLVSFFTTFQWPVQLEDRDADMLEEVFQNCCAAGSRELVLLLNCPGGDALAAERIVNVCHSFSKNNKFSVIVPKMAKSAATMICLAPRGASLDS